MKRKILGLVFIFLFVGTCIIPVIAEDCYKPLTIIKNNPEITFSDIVLEIEYVQAKIGKIIARIKNNGDQKADNVSWIISLIPKSGIGIPGWGYFEGVIPIINPQESYLIQSSGFLIGFGFYNLTISAECEFSYLIETKNTVFIFLFFIFIFK